MRDKDVGIIVLCPVTKKDSLKHTCCSAKYHTYNRECIAIVSSKIKSKELEQLKEITTVYKGKETITSLVNAGMKRLNHEWGLIVFSGSRFKPYVENKLMFATSEKDVLFPVYEQNTNFADGPFNGILINKDFFQFVGDFPDLNIKDENVNDFEMAKVLWANQAINAGGQFKGVLGLRVE